MPMVCAVYGCSNRSNREKGKGFYRVPKIAVHKGEKCRKLTEKRRKMWISNLHLQSGGAESANARVCSDHFLKGCPSSLFDVESVDWAPTVNLGYQRNKPKSEAPVQREQSTKLKEDQQRWSEGAEAMSDLQQTGCGVAGCQTGLTVEDIDKMEDVLRQNTTELTNLRTKALDTQFNRESFENDDNKAKFYTGLPNSLVLLQTFELCEPYITCGPMFVLSKFQQFVLVLLRLRLNLSLTDLAFRFSISLPTASRVWHKIIDILYNRLGFLIEWPERHVLHTTMPMAFQQAFGSKAAVIVDRFEVFVQGPSNLQAQAQTWSNYKHQHAVKFLIGVAPQGCVTYVSCAWRGGVSDEQITIESGLLKNLLPGDIVLADHGFSVGGSVGFYCASLQTPPFTEERKQLSAYEVEDTREIANVQIHVDRVLGLVRRKYQILHSRALSIEHMATKPGEALALIEKIGVICCVLSNLSLSSHWSKEEGKRIREQE
ncbi:uncharacterized protein LOC106529864 [Austrofundulus limnaeus]|uniref:Uncharacterized protein LOC106529864 n=1 Tax=Austrofundulus limnaeus TaxID=52670 RepID=A0A2I4CLG9_AUSLI|nr:PREDICTED: uncharacterized protein LOC106529864 [Austrofundulus limnaeus]